MIHSSQTHAVRSPKEQEYLDGWRRARAELDNYRKRAAEERRQDKARALREVISSLLSLADNFQAIVEHVPPTIAKESWTQGVLHVARQFDQLLSEYGVTPLGEANQDFDPLQHEAIGDIPASDGRPGKVAEVLQRGYMLGTKVIRPAKVKITS
jgi:molecular chaperone GrpE